MYIVDRIEGNFAVCETPDEDFINIPLSEFPSQVHEGDVLVSEQGRWQVDAEQTRVRKERIAQKMQRLFGNTQQ